MEKLIRVYDCDKCDGLGIITYFGAGATGYWCECDTCNGDGFILSPTPTDAPPDAVVTPDDDDGE